MAKTKNKPHKWSKEEITYLGEITPGRGSKEIQQMMTEKFNYPYTITQVRAKIKSCKFKMGIDSKFQKGHTPKNKGTKGVSKPNQTSFQKGHEPHNKKLVGSERKNTNGYVEIKVEEPNKWRLKQRVLYEQYHNTILKPDQLILFLNGDKTDFSKENLQLVTKKQIFMMCKEGLLTDDTEITRTGLNIANILLKLKELQK